MKIALLVSVFATLTQGLAIPNQGGSSDDTTALSGDSAVDSSQELIPDRYIIVLKDGHDEEEYKAHGSWIEEKITDLKKRGEFEGETDVETFDIPSFHGYAANLTSSLLQSVEEDPLVDFVEQDSEVRAYGFQTQQNAPWGLARISSRASVRPGSTSYIYSEDAGKGVTAYVIDTGIMTSHPDFENRAQSGPSVGLNPSEDGSGHGTHVAGTIGGKVFGVAKKVDLVSIRVLDSNGRGSVSTVIQGVQAAVGAHQAKTGGKGSVINMSLGGGASRALDLIVEAAVRAGIHVVVAAGNDNQDACQDSPPRSKSVITVGSMNIQDQKASTSNWGTCVDILGPGERILSAGTWSESQIMSGTSMASPHVAGLVASILSASPKNITPAEMKLLIQKMATRNAITGFDSQTPNLLAFNGGSGGLA